MPHDLHGVVVGTLSIKLTFIALICSLRIENVVLKNSRNVLTLRV